MFDEAHSPPGPPVVGSMPRLADDPLRFLVGVQQAYGDRYSFVRVDPAVADGATVVLDAELVHEILADRERFERPNAAPEERRREGLLSSDGALWEQQRSVLQPEFVGDRLSTFADVASGVVEDLLDDWPAEGRVDLLEEMSVVTTRVITQSLFSRDTSRERAIEVQGALDEIAAEFEPGVADFLLPDALQPGPSESFEEADDALDEFAMEFVEWHRAQSDPPRDMITALLEAEADPEVELADDELVDETVLFMTAGQETTALTLLYAFYWLSKHPEAYERVQCEAEEVLDGDPPGWGDLSALTETERAVRETLRLTPAAWNLTRETREPTELAGVELPEGESLLMSTYAHHRDRRVWDDPEAFRPERWANGASRADDSYFPFGSGPRVCIGRQVALTEAQFTLAHVLQHYDVEVLTETLDLQPAVTLRPSHPVRARVTER
jgi:cytochrome P450